MASSFHLKLFSHLKETSQRDENSDDILDNKLISVFNSVKYWSDWVSFGQVSWVRHVVTWVSHVVSWVSQASRASQATQLKFPFFDRVLPC